MYEYQCKRKHPKYKDECHKFDFHGDEHHNLITNRRWTDADYDKVRMKEDEYYEQLQESRWI